MRVVTLAAEGKLQHAHAGKMKVPAQCLDVFGDHSEILGYQRQLAELVLQHTQQIVSRRMPPFTRAGIRRRRGHGPVCRERSEVIETQQVETLELLTHPQAPQGKSVPQHRVPVVERIAPQLPGLGEVIGRHAGHRSRPAIGLELELAAMSPGLRGVGSDIERQIAEQADAALMSMGTQPPPLHREGKLLALHLPQRLLKLTARNLQRPRVAVAQFRWPSPPRRATVALAERLIQSIVRQPRLRAVQKRLELAAAALGPLLGIQQSRVAGKVRADPVRGALGTGGSQRKCLQDAEARIGQPVDTRPPTAPQWRVQRA